MFCLFKKYLPASNKDLGIGHTTDDISKIRPSNVSDLINYYESINKKMIDFFNSEKSKNLNKKITETGNSQVHELMRMVTGTFQHWGQVNYIRGIIEKRIWYTGNTKEKR